jgi:hypothetical protein
MKLLLPALTLIIGGCASSGIVPTGQDTFIVSKTGGGFQSGATVKAAVYVEANDFCAKSGNVIETISTHETEAGFGKQPSAELQFKCVARR